MIGYISGKVTAVEENKVTLENNGIGFEIICSAAALERLGNEKSGGVFTYLQMKEDGLYLFGFDTAEEKKMFLKLVSVSGVGAKMAINVLSSMRIKDLALAIAGSDVKGLSKIKGLGKKTAERIIVELRESVEPFTVALPAGSGKTGTAAKNVKVVSEADNAAMALVSLGYTKAVAVEAVNGAVEGGATTLESIIAEALRSLG